jgi:hypothetical protein
MNARPSSSQSEPVGVATSPLRWSTASSSTGDDDAMGGYTYDELVRLHEQMTKQVNQLTVEGLVEFRVNQHKGRIEVLVDGPYDHEALKSLVAGIPRDAYEALETAGAAEAAAVSHAGPAAVP